ncbi:MAG: hypothetical protein HY079_06835 [Elusimicrobia bacterium]|nr:hypothetical protein [Elusimicrobiota bacterium]
MRIADAALLALSLSTGACVSGVKAGLPPEPAEAVIARRSLAMTVIGGWHETSALAARRLVQKYGVPDEVHYGRGYGRGEDMGVIEQTVDYPLDAAQAAAVGRFDPRVRYDAANAALSARSDREEVNVLRLNLADEIAGRGLDPAAAREEFARTLALEQAGKTSAAMLGLRFTPVKVSRP